MEKFTETLHEERISSILNQTDDKAMRLLLLLDLKTLNSLKLYILKERKGMSKLSLMIESALAEKGY